MSEYSCFMSMFTQSR